ncbi:MAG: response regulator, partial [Desulfobacteria bacterium]
MLETSCKGKVLIIDDEPGVRDLLSETLSEVGGYETMIAADGLDGIEKIRNNEFDVIFTDMAMPRLNGMDFLKKCKDINNKTPIVVLTGVSSIEIAVNAMRQGAYDFMTKPLRLDKILSTTEKIIGERKLFGRLMSSQGSEASLQSLNAELFKNLRKIVALHSISTDVDGCHENKEIFAKAAGMAAKLLTVNEVSFGIIQDGLLDIKSAIGVVGKAFPLAGTLFARVIDKKRYHVADVGETSPYNGAAMPSQFLAIPLVVGDEVFGILSVSG